MCERGVYVRAAHLHQVEGGHRARGRGATSAHVGEARVSVGEVGEQHAPRAHLVAHLEGLCHGGVLALLGLATHARLGIVEGRLVHEDARPRAQRAAETHDALARPRVARVDDAPPLAVEQRDGPRVEGVCDGTHGEALEAEPAHRHAHAAVARRVGAVDEVEVERRVQRRHCGAQPVLQRLARARARARARGQGWG